MKGGSRRQQDDKGLRCAECGKLLRAFACSECNGSGVRRFLLIFERPCDVCDGRGSIIRCPDALTHIRAKFFPFRLGKPPSTFTDTKSRGLGTSAPPGAKSRLGRNVSPGALSDYLHPGTKPCPKCGGKGTIAKSAPNPNLGQRYFEGRPTITWYEKCAFCGGRGRVPLKRGGL